MHAKHPSIHDRPQTEMIKHITAIPPDVDAPVLALALVVEAVHLGDVPRLVIPADERDAVGVPDFEDQEEEKGLDRVEAAVDEVAYRHGVSGYFRDSRLLLTHEEVVGLGTPSSNLEQLQQIEELPMNVPAYLRIAHQPQPTARHVPTYRHRTVHILHIPLLDQQLLGLPAQPLDLFLGDGFAALELGDLSARGS